MGSTGCIGILYVFLLGLQIVKGFIGFCMGIT